MGVQPIMFLFLTHPALNTVQTPGPGAYRAPSEFGFYESQGKSKPQNMSQTNTNLGEQPIKEEQQEENK